MAQPTGQRHLSHLDPSVLEVMSRDAKERIEWLYQPRWIGYQRAQEILTRLQNLLAWPKTHRMPNLLILGETNSGKTTIVEKFLERNPVENRIEEEYLSMPVLLVQVPPRPDESQFYNAILRKLFAPFKANDNATKKQMQVLNLLGRINVRVVILDEIQHILAGHLEKQRHFLNVIKFLGNELRVPIVGVGTKEALRAIQSDPQLANRFEPMPLPRWTLNRDFQKLLASFEAVLPLQRPSQLHLPPLAAELLTRCEGNIGELSALLNAAATQAIQSGEERITVPLLDDLPWTLPSQRQKVAERLL